VTGGIEQHPLPAAPAWIRQRDIRNSLSVFPPICQLDGWVSFCCRLPWAVNDWSQGGSGNFWSDRV